MGYIVPGLEVSEDGGKTFNYSEVHEKQIAEDVFGTLDESSVFECNIKWYSVDKDMAEYSKKHKDLVFKMYISYTNEDSRSVMYYKDGKVQDAGHRFIYDNFDEEKLEPICEIFR